MTAHAHVVREVALQRRLSEYLRAFAPSRGAFLLDGGGAPASSPHLAAFSLLSAEPRRTFRAWRTPRGARVVVADRQGVRRAEVGDALAALQELLAEDTVARESLEPSPLPFAAGAVGTFGYEVGQLLERMPNRPRPGQGMPDVAFGFYAWVLGQCRATGRAWLSVVGRGARAADARRDAERVQDRVLATLAAFDARAPEGPPLPAPPPKDAPPALVARARLRAALSRDAYVARVVEAQRRIARGDAFEICLTNAYDAPFEHDPRELFEVLRRDNPAPFAAILDLPEGAIVSSSPERFLRLDARGLCESRPIKGTRPRGATAEDDARARVELATSPKDLAENTMIVDLVRSDLGRVCRIGSVTVPELHVIEPYPTVHQLVSTVRGELAEGRTAIDLVRACFPPGSMTGAPKIEAMRILEHLEPRERGVYSGALGYVDITGAMDLSVVIRAIVVRRGRAHVGVGGAVLADSDPEAEHAETLDKIAALARALASFVDRPHPHAGDPARVRKAPAAPLIGARAELGDCP